MKKYGLIGYPLQHSFSKKYFDEKFANEGIANSVFNLYSISDISSLPDIFQDENLKGLAVTIPYKQSVIPYLDELDDVAKEVGAVNCIKFSKGKTKGFNTDVVGFENSFKKYLQNFHQKALVLGTGGSSKSVQYVLRKLNISFLVVSRNPVDSEISYEQIDKEVMSEYPIIINCTPVGMYPQEHKKPVLPYAFLTPGHYLFDLVYNPDITAFLKEGIKAESCSVNGLEMLYLQAEENWKIWNSD